MVQSSGQDRGSGDWAPAQPLTWDNFMLMPREEQEELLKYITGRFSVGTSAIANDLFHVSQHTLYRYIRREGLTYPTSRGGRIPEAVLQEWKKWVASISGAGAPGEPASAREAGAAVLLDCPSVEDTANALADVVRTMHDLYGKIRITIAVEPV